MIKVISYQSFSNVEICFLETKTVIKTRSDSIRSGHVKDPMFPIICGVGFIGIGNYSSSKKHDSKCYDHWTSMLTRCYDKSYQEKKPTYVGCTVHPEWHNFQNFAKWFYANVKGNSKGFHLDKDIKFDGNKIYSEATCVLVPACENISFTSSKEWEFKSPSGVIESFKSLRAFCIKNGLTESSMRMVSSGKRKQHKGWTVAG